MTGTAIVTGGSRGIGAAIARRLGQAGWRVCVNYVRDRQAAEAVAADIGSAIAVQADTGREPDVLRLFEVCGAELGTPTALVNNAAIHGPRGRFEALSLADMQDVLAVNVIGPMLCLREAIRRMSRRNGGSGGAIVNVSSGVAVHGEPGEGVLYAASKGALNSLGVGLSQELAGEGIRVNTVAPGLVRTDMPPPEMLAAKGPTIPIGRVGEAGEIAHAVCWLLSDEASYVAGANLRVAGGRL